MYQKDKYYILSSKDYSGYQEAPVCLALIGEKYLRFESLPSIKNAYR